MKGIIRSSLREFKHYSKSLVKTQGICVIMTAFGYFDLLIFTKIEGSSTVGRQWLCQYTFDMEIGCR